MSHVACTLLPCLKSEAVESCHGRNGSALCIRYEVGGECELPTCGKNNGRAWLSAWMMHVTDWDEDTRHIQRQTVIEALIFAISTQP
jgi:hypothetical protein